MNVRESYSRALEQGTLRMSGIPPWLPFQPTTEDTTIPGGIQQPLDLTFLLATFSVHHYLLIMVKKTADFVSKSE